VPRIGELITMLILPCGTREGQADGTTSMAHDIGVDHGWSILGGLSTSPDFS
jgi:hypothetical protein